MLASRTVFLHRDAHVVKTLPAGLAPLVTWWRRAHVKIRKDKFSEKSHNRNFKEIGAEHDHFLLPVVVAAQNGGIRSSAAVGIKKGF